VLDVMDLAERVEVRKALAEEAATIADSLPQRRRLLGAAWVRVSDEREAVSDAKLIAVGRKAMHRAAGLKDKDDEQRLDS
jgi:hypothetical protein